MKANDFVTFALKSPLHVMMGDVMLLTVTGRKTGRKISLPVGYYQDGNALWVISSRDRTWWRNLAHGGEVEMRLHGRDLKGYGEVILDTADVAAQLGQYVRRMPLSVRSLGVHVENGAPNCDDVARVAKERLFVRICIVG
ncbi:MAG TPA: nitroreductase/quinone reductase family protein [Anaerolineales bacterium]|nr:nitroreductase/quinone reductase family protein [Anaerolineales bacterium]